MKNDRNIKRLIVDGYDFFTGEVENGNLRIGQKDVISLDIPPHHDYFDVVKNIKTESNVEDMFDELVEKGIIKI